MRIDAHQHFWKYSPAEYGWISDAMPELKRDFLPSDLKPLLDANGFEGSIAVQARQDLDETFWLLELANQDNFIKGVVGWVDLCSQELPVMLKQLASQPKLVGVRHILQDEPDDRFMLRPNFRRGIARLADHGLTYDLLLHPRHLPIAVQLVQEFPRQRFVLDHIAKPGIADGLIEPWAREIRTLAKFENVWCKLSGMVTEARWKQWKPEDFRRHLDVVFDAFGTERLMIGSDWPVCTLSAGYSDTMGLVMQYAKDLPSQHLEALLGGNCARFYGLK
ncbi:amidohydrolase family protein [Telmatobacter sp. DSM 110680]|uniref:Amidohydrolase family protein n=1 Tax=Telmatobacter sp. DSM 110680 TaxID=3036704 RepID=A0AAU7DIE8_9BACT